MLRAAAQLCIVLIILSFVVRVPTQQLHQFGWYCTDAAATLARLTTILEIRLPPKSITPTPYYPKIMMRNSTFSTYPSSVKQESQPCLCLRLWWWCGIVECVFACISTAGVVGNESEFANQRSFTERYVNSSLFFGYGGVFCVSSVVSLVLLFFLRRFVLCVSSDVNSTSVWFTKMIWRCLCYLQTNNFCHASQPHKISNTHTLVINRSKLMLNEIAYDELRGREYLFSSFFC